MMKQLGIYKISYELLGELLELDDDHHVVDVYATNRERKQNIIGIKVEGPLMPKTPEGHSTAWVPLNHIQRIKEEQNDTGKT